MTPDPNSPWLDYAPLFCLLGTLLAICGVAAEVRLMIRRQRQSASWFPNAKP